MFLDFFYVLRSKGIPCSTSEYLDLLSVLENEKFNLQDYDISKFYFLARNCLVKETKYFHHYDQAFSEVFTGLLNHDDEFRKKLQEWLNNKVDHKLSEERLKNAMKLLPQDLMEQLKKRLEDQKKRHDTGNNWIGTSGTSAFGNSGYNPAGVRIGGEGQMRSGMIVAGRPDYEEYRTDQT